MKFIVTRTSYGWEDGEREPLDWNDEPYPAPWPGCTREQVFETIAPDYGYAWVLEVATLADVAAIFEKERIVLEPAGSWDPRAELPVLEIYDDRRE